MFNVQRNRFEEVPHGMAHHFGPVGGANFCDPGQFSMGQMTMACNFMHRGGGQYGNNGMGYMTEGQWHHQSLNSESLISNRGIINNDLFVVGDGIRDHRDEMHFRGSPRQVYQRSSVGADVFDVGDRNCAQRNDVQGVINGGSGAGVNGKLSVIQGEIQGSIFVGTSSTSNAKDGFERLSNILFVINSIVDDSARVIRFTVRTGEAFQCYKTLLEMWGDHNYFRCEESKLEFTLGDEMFLVAFQFARAVIHRKESHSVNEEMDFSSVMSVFSRFCVMNKG